MIELRPVESDADYAAWTHVRNVVVPNEPMTVEQVRRHDGEPDRLTLLAELDGSLAGCGVVGRSSFGGRAFMAPRVLPDRRGRGVGSALVAKLSGHARELGYTGVNAFVYADEVSSVAFARRYGLEDVDLQLEQVRTIAAEPQPQLPAGVRVVPLGDDRETVLREAWPVAREGYADMATPQPMEVALDEWLRDEATLPAGSFAAYEGDELVGYAGLTMHAEEHTAEHGLTVVRRDRRGRGIARALKQSELHWASENGIRELVTWTQRGNEAMQALNRSLGYFDRECVLTFQGPLP